MKGVGQHNFIEYKIRNVEKFKNDNQKILDLLELVAKNYLDILPKV